VIAVVGVAAIVGFGVAPAALAAGDPPAQGTSSPYPVVASGLDNPRQLAFSSNGDLYIAESGHGGSGPCAPSGDDPSVNTCFGTTGAITKVASSGGQQQVVTGLPSLAVQVATQNGQLPPGAQASGPSDVAVLDGDQIAFTVGLGLNPANRAAFAAAAPAGGLLGTLDTASPPATASDVTQLADIAGFEAVNNPVPPADAPDSNANAVLADGQNFLVVDAGGNDLLRVTPGGQVSLVTTFPSATKTCPPPPVQPQAVPTSVVRGPDGALYVSELTGFPFCEGGASIYRVTSDGTATVYASGLTNLTDLAFGPDGTLYAVEIAQHGLQQAPIGAVVAIPPGGGDDIAGYRIVASGLFAPYGIALRGDFAYVTTGSILPASAGGGNVIRIPTGCNFSDVPESSPFHTDICGLTSAGFINGYQDGTFRPTTPVSRQAFAAFLGRIHGYTGQCATSAFSAHSRFSDVPDSSPFCAAINGLATEGVIQGYADSTFKPTNQASRQALAAYLWRDYQFQQGDGSAVTGDAPQTNTTFPDVPKSNVFSGDIQFGVDKNLINGYQDGQFKPAAVTTRQAAAAFLSRLGQLEAGDDFPASGVIPPPTS